MPHEKLHLLPFKEYAGIDSNDPIRFCFWPFTGNVYEIGHFIKRPV
jgi:hypothetical protein